MTDDIICVAVENTVYHFDMLFEYIVPENLKDKALPGCRVAVPFGRGNSTRQGMIFSYSSGDCDKEKLKKIVSVIDERPVMSLEMLKMAAFIKERYFCTYHDALKPMLPLGITYKEESFYKVHPSLGDDVFDLSDEYRAVVRFITSKGGEVPSKKLEKEFSFLSEDTFSILLNENVLVLSNRFKRKAGDKTVRMVRLCDDSNAYLSLKLTSKQKTVIETLETCGAVSVKEISYYTGVTSSVVDGLVKKGIAEYFDDEVFRIPKSDPGLKKEYILTDEQKKAYDTLYSLYTDEKPHVCLLYGITGSGKTSVFFKIMEQVIGDGKDVIVTVPEIALTPQLISVFKSHFGDRVAVFHSALSQGERLDEYKRVEKGLANIVIGTRSAVFAPFKNLGLIIMDEEQEHTYKSEGKPRYHARDLAKFRCSFNKALLILSSATPSLETYYYAGINRYEKVTLTKRFGNAILPKVITVDMDEERRNGNSSVYSNLLLEEIEKNLLEKKQSILLLNRRGYNTYVSCRSCNESISCPNCSITLTYHNANRRLMCHYCGHSVPVPKNCPTCGSDKLRYFGAGTQRAQSDLSDIFPDARILRMDTDTTMSRSSHEKLLSSFERGEYDILVGTQMVAKGLDFPNVTLVGILNADMMLNSDDFRANENTFSLLTQVIGRSGRGDLEGKAIIQSMTPYSHIIQLSKNQDYDAFYEDEIVIRKTLLYPPFVELTLIGFIGDEHQHVAEASGEFTKMLEENLRENYPSLAIRLLGPSPMTVVKVSSRYRYKIIIKSINNSIFREMLRDSILRFEKDRRFSDVSVYVDVGPLSM